MTRHECIRFWIKEYLTKTLRYAKRGWKVGAKEYSDHLFGLLMFLRSTGDISDEIFDKVYNLRMILEDKYNLF